MHFCNLLQTMNLEQLQKKSKNLFLTLGEDHVTFAG